MLPLLLVSETPDALDGQMDSSTIHAHFDCKYQSEIEPDRDVVTNTVNLNRQNSCSVQKGKDLAVTNVVAQLLKSDKTVVSH